MEDVTKSFVLDVSNSLKSQLTSDLWKEFDSTPNLNKVAFLVMRTRALETIETALEAELNKHQNLEQSFAQVMAGWNFSKSQTKALLFKSAGNVAFGEGNNERALDLYSQAIAFVELGHTTDLSILYANRSAALFHLGHYSKAQTDIDLAFDLQYPPELQYKLYERSGRCFAKEGRNPDASRRFQQAINALSHPAITLDDEKKKGVRSTLQKLLKSSSGTGFGFIYTNGGALNDTCGDSILPKTAGGRGKYLRNASGKLSLMRSEEEGRYVVANENIGPGEIIVVEKAYVSTLTPEAYHYQCFHCFTMLLAPVPCSRCALVSFCSIQCRNLAWATHHQYECDILGILRLAGVSITCLMAFRILTQSSYPDIMKWKAEEPEDEPLAEQGKKTGNWRDFQFQFKDDFKPDNITSVLKLVSHSTRRTTEDYFHRVVMALFLYTVLRRTKYFFKPSVGSREEPARMSNEDKTKLENELECSPETIIHVGSLLLRLLQTLQFNAHEIAGWDNGLTKSTFIGGGLFPTLAFFNHSCNPAIVRYFINDTVVVRTVRTVQKGEPVTENYGPIFTQSDRIDRQQFLNSRYWFTCNCIACQDDWPLFENLSREKLNFRCRNCRSFLCKNTTESFSLLLRCGRCLKPTNMLQSLKSLEKSEGKFNEAMKFLGNGKSSTAEGILVENIRLFDSLLLPPFPDYHSCQEGLRKCFLPMGNQSNSLKIKSKSTMGNEKIVL